VINSHIALINQLSGHENASYTVYNVSTQAEPDGSHTVYTKGSDHKNYQVQVSSNPPFILAARQIVLLD
jgi:hypothetical protein